MSYANREFKKLRKYWYEKLRSEGFQDIETDSGHLIESHSAYQFSRRISFKSISYESTRDYFFWAESQLLLGKFQSESDKLIWKLHSDGRTTREIAREVKLGQQWISTKIRRIRRYLQNG